MSSDVDIKGSVYRPANAEGIGGIAAYNARLRPSMVLTNAFVNTEGAKLGYLLSRLLNVGSSHTVKHFTFFANSTHEGLAGAIKLARHTAVRRQRAAGGWVLFVDEELSYRPFFDPVDRGDERALAPHICFVESVEAASERFPDHDWAAIVLVRRASTPLGSLELRRVFADGAAQGALRIVCNAALDLDDPGLFPGVPDADVYVFGENLVERQVPFGCLTMTASAYSVWNNPRDSVAHTSTFGGNGLCLALAIGALDRHGLVEPEDRAVFAAIDGGMRQRIDYFAAHVNPFAAQGMEMSGFALDVQEAFGGTLRLAGGRVVTDCAACSGTVLRGHNPADLCSDVLDRHDPNRDYFDELESLLADLTGFEHALPAVSGATAVDAAVSMAMLANPGRSKIVTFHGNFSGKSLISMNLSKYGQQFTESDREAFRPYYVDLIYVDPFAATAARILRRVLGRDDVALVWFEAIQGMECKPVPLDVLAVVDEMKADHGYLVGVDEVLTGVWRTGDRFLCHPDLMGRADVSTLAKPLSDATVPMGVALVSGEVMARATAERASHVERLRQHYRNGLGAHIALHALVSVNTPDSHASRRASQQALNRALRDIAETSRLFESAEGRGGHVRLVLRRRWFPFSKRSQLGKLLEAAISELILRDCDILVMQLRFFPRVFADEIEILDAMARLKRGTDGYTPWTVYWHAIKQVVAFAVAQTLRNHGGDDRMVGKGQPSTNRGIEDTALCPDCRQLETQH